MTFVSGYQGILNPLQSAVIAQGATLSEVIKCGGMSLVGVVVPYIFTGTTLTFYVGDSADGFQASGQAAFSGVGSNNDTLVINGVTLTFKTTPTVALDVQIGASATLTVANLLAVLQASTNAGLLACTYAAQGAYLLVKAVVHGTAGNAYTFSKSSTAITLTPSGGTLDGGGFRQLYDSTNAAISLTVAAGLVYQLNPVNFYGVNFLKVKSGTTEVADRTLYLSLKGF